MIIKILNFLLQKRIIAQLKKKNNICINAFCYENRLTYPVYVSDKKFENCVHLLLISNENKSHYISKILTDLCVIKQKIKIKNIFASVVYNVLVVKKILIKHKENCLIINGKQTVKLKSGSIKFKNYFKQLSVPFKIYADFECLLRGVQSSDKNNSSYTEKYQDHIPCSFAYKVVCVDNKFSKKVLFYRGKNAINISITPKMVNKVITNLDSSKASGPDFIPVVVLKNCEPELSYILAKLFNKCLKESCFPDCWKVSSVVPVFKNVGERSTAKNYRPVSLLSVVSKVFEKLVNNRIVDHLEKCGLFSDFQYGFRSSRSTADLLTVVSDRIARAFNRSGATRAVALDISKAFDRVWHAGLLHKLKSYGISGQIFGLISSFLSNRRLRVVLDGKSSEEYPVNAGVPQGSILGPTLFLLYINDLPDDVICNIAIYADDTTLYSKCNQASDLWQQLELASELESDLRDTVDWGRKWLVDFNAGKTQLVSFDRSKNTGAINVKMDGSVLEDKTSFKMLGLTFSSKLDWGAYIVSIAKTASKKIGALIRSMKFLSPEVALYLYKSTIRPCMEYCCHVWAGAPSCYLELLDKLQKRICRTVGPSLAASLEPLAHRQNVASLSLFYRYYFGRCSSELAQLVPLPYSRGRSTRYSDRLHDFSVTIPRCYKDVYVNSFFPRTARLWNSLPIECFPLTYDLSGFKSRINRYLLTVGSF